MIKIHNKQSKNRIVKMTDMEPLEVGIIITKGKFYNDYIIRIPHLMLHIWNLSKPSENMDSCITSEMILEVRLLNPGEKAIVEFSND